MCKGACYAEPIILYTSPMEPAQHTVHIYWKQAIIALLLGAVGLYLANAAVEYVRGYGFIGSGQPSTISVEGTGEITVTPDIATFTAEIRGSGETERVAQSELSAKENAALTFLRAQGVIDSDIKTEGYTVYPVDESWYYDSPYPNPLPSGQTGFEATETITVTVRNIVRAGEIVGGVAERGVSIYNVTLGLDDEEAVRADAQVKAIANAREKAEKIAAGLGVRVTRVVSFYDNSNYYYEDIAMSSSYAGMAEGVSSVPRIPTGEHTVTSSVTVEYEIR